LELHKNHTRRMVKSLFGVERKNQLLPLKIKALKLEAKSFATSANSNYTERKDHGTLPDLPKLLVKEI